MKKFLLSILLGFSLFSISNPIVHAFAETSKYSDVIEDLSVDSNFDINNYPEVSNDYSLEVITLAEGKNKELFVYVYQPSNDSKDLVASSINIGLSLEEKYSPKVYDLRLVSTNGRFDKYVVENLVVSSDVQRIYSVVSIKRLFDSSIDNVSNDNTISEVSYEVGKLFTFTDVGDETVISAEKFRTITITNKFIGMIRYMDKYGFFSEEYTDSHFVAFNTDLPMDQLLEADLVYKTQEYIEINYVNPELNDYKEPGEISDNIYLTLKHTDNYGNNGFLFTDTYSYSRIQSTSDMLDNEKEKLSEESLDAINQTKWVLRFCETNYKKEFFPSYSYSSTGDLIDDGRSYYSVDCTKVYDVSILRLEFRYNENIYNLGVVDNVSSGSNDPINPDWDEPNNALDALWDKINELFTSIKTLGDLISFIFKLIGIGLGVALVIALIVMLLKVIPIHEWLAALITAPFSKNKKNKKKNKS